MGLADLSFKSVACFSLTLAFVFADVRDFAPIEARAG